MGEILYLKIEQNVVVHRPEVTLKDVAKISSANKSIANKLKTMKVYTFREPVSSKKKGKKQIEVFSVLKLIQMIGEIYPHLEIQNLGEADFVLEYVPKEESKWWGIVKATIICILIFFGSAFSIMTFNIDAGIPNIFSLFHKQVMGVESSGFTILEVCYAIGLGFGILVFFNHFGKKKITLDPTPMQVQMRMYEQDVDTTFIENCSRKGTNIDVD